MPVHFTGNFPDFFTENMLPAIKAVMDEAQKTKPQVAPRLFQQETTTRPIEQYSGFSGLNLLRRINEGASITVDQAVQGFDKTFKPVKYGLGFGITEEVVLADKIGFVKKQSINLGESEVETREIQAAAIFNNAFTAGDFAGPDAVALCSASHPLVKAGGVQSNLLTVAADLDVTSLQLALTQWEGMVKSNGIQMSLPRPRLLVQHAERWNASEILKGAWRSDTAQHTINAFRYGEHGEAISEIIVWSKLTDPDAWFLVAPPAQTGLVWLYRRKPYTKPYYDEWTETAYTFRRYMADVGFYDYVGVFGTPGV